MIDLQTATAIELREARERIAELEAAIKAWDVPPLLVRIAKLEQQLAELRKALESIAKNTCCDRCQEASLVAQAALQGGE